MLSLTVEPQVVYVGVQLARKRDGEVPETWGKMFSKGHVFLKNHVIYFKEICVK